MVLYGIVGRKPRGKEMNEKCFVGNCQEETKSGIVTKKGHEFSSCEKHEDVFYEEFVRPLESSQ